MKIKLYVSYVLCLLRIFHKLLTFFFNKPFYLFTLFYFFEDGENMEKNNHLINRESKLKNYCSLVYNKFLLFHWLFPFKLFKKMLSLDWDFKHIKVDDLTNEELDKTTGRIFLQTATILVFPHPIIKHFCTVEQYANSFGFSCRDLSDIVNFEGLSKFRKEFFHKCDVVKKLSLVEKGLINNSIKGLFLIGKIDLILKNLIRDRNFSNTALKYKKKLQNDSYNFYNHVSEILNVEAFYDKGLLMDVEKGKKSEKKFDLLINVKRRIIEVEIFAPNPEVEDKLLLSGSNILVKVPSFYPQDRLFRDIYEKLEEKLAKCQFSGKCPGILLIDITFSSIGAIEFKASLLNLIKKIQKNELMSLEYPLTLPKELSGILVIDRKTEIFYFSIPDVKKPISKKEAEEIIMTLNLQNKRHNFT